MAPHRVIAITLISPSLGYGHGSTAVGAFIWGDAFIGEFTVGKGAGSN